MKLFIIALFLFPVRLYRLFLSPFLTPSCRFAPSCSEYAEEAIRQHGPVKGVFLGIKRILRCHPWGGCGYDPVPRRKAGPSKGDVRVL